MSVKNTENRSKRKYVSLNGTVSTPNHHFRNRGLSGDSSIGEIDTFKKLHFRETEGWVSDYSRTSYVSYLTNLFACFHHFINHEDVYI